MSDSSRDIVWFVAPGEFNTRVNPMHGPQPDLVRAAFVAQVRKWWKGLLKPVECGDMAYLCAADFVLGYVECVGWPATLEAIAEALRSEGGPT